MEPIDSLLTARQLQDLLQVDRITIYRMLKDGRLEGFKVGGQWRFSRQTVQRWLNQQQSGLDYVEPPPPTAEVAPSAEGLPLACIQAIQGIFAEALGVGTVTTAADGSPLTEISNSCEFCRLILGTEAGHRRCRGTWRGAIAAAQIAEPQVAVCHAGLNYVWGHIELRGEFVAATFAGQFLNQAPDHEKLAASHAELSAVTGLESDRLWKARTQVPVLDSERQHRVPTLLKRATETFSEIGEERLSLLERLQRIAEMSRIETS
jgi:excisionase family DNA binding protein